MLRARLRLGAILVGFLVVLGELGCAIYSEVSLQGFRAQQSAFVVPPPFPERVVAHLPTALLALAGVLGAVVVYRAIRGRSHWSWFAAALAPVASLLVIYRPSVTWALLPLHTRVAVLPWAAPFWWAHPKAGSMVVGNTTEILGLQIAAYLAAAAYVLAIVLVLPRRRSSARIAAGVPARGSPHFGDKPSV